MTTRTTSADMRVLALALAAGAQTPPEQRAISAKLAGLATAVHRMEITLNEITAESHEDELRRQARSGDPLAPVVNDGIAIVQATLDAIYAAAPQPEPDRFASTVANAILMQVLQHATDRAHVLAHLLHVITPALIDHGFFVHCAATPTGGTDTRH